MDRLTLPDVLLAKAARTQFGAFSRAQALEVGFGPRDIERRLADGAWQVLHPKVYAASTTPRSPSLMAGAARLYAGAEARYSHLSAARLHGVDVGRAHEFHWLTVPTSVIRRRRPGVVLTRSRHIIGWTASAHGQPVMSLPRLPVDLAACLDEVMLRRALHQLVASGRTSVEQVLAAAEGLGGRAGLDLLRRVADDYDAASESVLEEEADALFVTAGILLQRQVEVWDGPFLLARLDFGDPATRLGVEIDGDRYHSSKQAREHDRRRDRSLVRRGWTIMRFGTDDVRRSPQALVAEVADVQQRLTPRSA